MTQCFEWHKYQLMFFLKNARLAKPQLPAVLHFAMLHTIGVHTTHTTCACARAHTQCARDEGTHGATNVRAGSTTPVQVVWAAHDRLIYGYTWLYSSLLSKHSLFHTVTLTLFGCVADTACCFNINLLYLRIHYVATDDGTPSRDGQRN